MPCGIQRNNIAYQEKDIGETDGEMEKKRKNEEKNWIPSAKTLAYMKADIDSWY